MNISVQVYLTIEITKMPVDKDGNPELDPGTLETLLRNTLHQPFDDGVVDLNLPDGAQASVSIDEVKF